MATPRIPLVLALHGEPDRLVSKPDTYAELLQLARKPTIFSHQLDQFKDEEITFRFTWDENEVVLDESAFEFVQARARLLIITPDRATPMKLEHLASSSRPAVASEPTPKRVKVEEPPNGQIRVEIDLTMDEPSDEPLPMFDNPADVEKENIQPNVEGPNVVEAEASDQIRPVPNEDGQTDAAHHTASQSTQAPLSQSAAQNVEPSPCQAVAIRRLTAQNFTVSMGSKIRTVPPQRQLVPQQWVNCREPWPEEVSGPNIGKFTIRILTEHNIMPCTFKSNLVRFGTLKGFIRDRGYPTPRPVLTSTPGRDSNFDDSALFRNNISEGSDVYVSQGAKPGLYFLPPYWSSRRRFDTDPVSVTLELCPGWKFQSLYPWTAIESLDDIETAQWKVSVDKLGGTFTDVGSEKYVGHLSWEITLDTVFKPQFGRIPPFITAEVRLTPKTSVVLNRRHVLSSTKRGLADVGVGSYLRSVLTDQLGLPQDMVQDFEDYFDARFGDEIQSWKESLSIAIQFAPQNLVEGAARISIIPHPDTTARVLMLFGAVDTTGSRKNSIWADRRRNVSSALKARNWAEIIGIQPKALKDSAKFRAVEWNVMQVATSGPDPHKPRDKAK